jgi:hypothetical protein
MLNVKDAPGCKYLYPSFEMKELSEDGQFEGYASVHGNIDRGNDIIAPGAFRKSLAQHRRDKTFPELFFGHDSRNPIGDIEELAEDDTGLKITGRLWVDGAHPDPHALKARRLLRAGRRGSAGFSIGYRTIKAVYDSKTEVRTLKEVELWEVSVVTIPMNPKARATSAKDWTVRQREEALREAGASSSEAKKLANVWQSIAAAGSGGREVHGSDRELADMIRSLERTIRS